MAISAGSCQVPGRNSAIRMCCTFKNVRAEVELDAAALSTLAAEHLLNHKERWRHTWSWAVLKTSNGRSCRDQSPLA